jgi:hypothetical protein
MTAPLRQALTDYLTVRRALGFRLARAEALLDQFVEYLDAHQAGSSRPRWSSRRSRARRARPRGRG